MVCQTVISFSRAWKEADAFVDANHALAQRELITETSQKIIKTLFKETVPAKTIFQDTAREVTLEAARKKMPNQAVTELEDRIQHTLNIKKNNKNFTINLDDLVDDLDDT